MRTKHQELKMYLEKAKSLCGQDKELTSVQKAIGIALSYMTAADKQHKKARNENSTTPLEKWKLDLATGSLTFAQNDPSKAKSILAGIEQQIEAEKAKLNSLVDDNTSKPATSQNPESPLFG